MFSRLVSRPQCIELVLSLTKSRQLTWTAWSGLADIILAILAWVIILPMQMRTKDKVGVAVAMSLGIV